jgi:hypothetical protein
MATLEAKSIDKPDERRDFPRGHLDLVSLGDQPVGRSTFQPGWRWSESVKPIAGTGSCQFFHVAYVMAGRMHVRADDGSELEIGPGDAVTIPPGHDAWVVGDEDCVMVDFGHDSADYAKAR